MTGFGTNCNAGGGDVGIWEGLVECVGGRSRNLCIDEVICVCSFYGPNVGKTITQKRVFAFYDLSIAYVTYHVGPGFSLTSPASSDRDTDHTLELQAGNTKKHGLRDPLLEDQEKLAVNLGPHAGCAPTAGWPTAFWSNKEKSSDIS
jgi:hypothetical protein